MCTYQCVAFEKYVKLEVSPILTYFTYITPLTGQYLYHTRGNCTCSLTYIVITYLHNLYA